MHWFLILVFGYSSLKIPMDDMAACVKARDSYEAESWSHSAACMSSGGDYLQKQK